MSALTTDEVLLNDQLLYDLNMGYATRKNIHHMQSIRFIPKEANYIHPWSFEATGEVYGMNQLEKYIPLRDYLELPSHMVDRVITGVIEGKDKRRKAEEEEKRRRDLLAETNNVKNNANVHTGSEELDPVTREMIRAMGERS
jgi:hypothetical protein